jgi:hypothetical protein
MQFYRAIYNSAYLSGKGSPGHCRAVYPCLVPISEWKSILEHGSDRQLQCLIRMMIPQFKELIEDLKLLKFPQHALKLSFEDKLLLVFIWLIKYLDYSELSTLFGISITVVSQIITGYLDALVPYFTQYISNKQWTNRKPSTLSN